MKKLRIIFMGTPEFAVGVLDAIVEANFNVVGVVTAADKPAGRGQKIKYSAVKEYALEKGLKVLQPTNLKDPQFLEELRSLQANVQVVVAFRMLPEVVWRMPELGTFNLHASLLPQYRGAAPINWAIINGEEKTGVTTFFIDDKIDTGAIIHSVETGISPDEDAGTLHDRLLDLGRVAVTDTLRMIGDGEVRTTVQPEVPGVKTAYKLNRDNMRIDWQKPGREVYNLIRGLSPYPAAYTVISDGDQQWDVRVFRSRFEPAVHHIVPGKVVAERSEFKVAVPDGWIYIDKLQFPGKKAMSARDLLNGMRISEAAIAR